MSPWSSSKAVGCAGFAFTFCWVFPVLQMQTRGLFHPPTVPVFTLVLSAAEMLHYCVLSIAVLTFLSEAGRENRQMSSWAAACALSERLLLCLDKTNCKLPWKVLKQPWNSAFPSLISFHEARQPEPKSSSYPLLREGEFSFTLARPSRSACLIKWEETERSAWLANSPGQRAEWPC